MTGRAAIIGGGVIGGGWAARFLLNGWDVCLFDPAPEAESRMAAVLENARYALPMLYDRALPPEGRLSFAGALSEAVQGADWVQESVPERLDLKHKVLQAVQTISKSRTVIGSSTSGFKPSELQRGATHPEHIIVTHPFNPVYLLPLVEVVASPKNPTYVIDTAKEILTSIGLYPLTVGTEIDGHIADRLLEAVWREALWLVNDGIATTAEIDEAIRMGFGLRWAQMGLFETYRIAGGEAGMRHFLAQFGPALNWPWTKLTDVPELTDKLIERIATQSDAQSGARSIRALERLRDENLVAILRALKARGQAAGAVIINHEALITPSADSDFPAAPIETLDRTVPVDWADYNGHMNESRYGQAFSDAGDAIMRRIGADADYVTGGLSYFTVDTHTRFLAEALVGQRFRVLTRCLLGAGKKMRLYHEMLAEDGKLLATCEQFLVHVSLENRRSCQPSKKVAAGVLALAAAHANLPLPDHLA